jgi:hypothetical protein
MTIEIDIIILLFDSNAAFVMMRCIIIDVTIGQVSVFFISWELRLL